MPTGKYLFAFFIVNLLLSSYYLDTWKNPNTTSRVLQVQSLTENGKLYIDGNEKESIDISYVNGHYYPDKPPFPVFLVFPVYKALVELGVLSRNGGDDLKAIFRLGSFITGSLSLVLIMVMTFLRLMKSGFGIRRATLMSTLPFYASMFFVYSGTFYAHLLTVLLILASFNLIEKNRNLPLAGLLSGAAFLSEYLSLIIFATWFFQLWHQRSLVKAMQYAAGMLPFLLVFAWYNTMVTGHPLKTAYAYHVYYELNNGGFTWPSISALLSMLFSPWRGVIFYASIFVAFLPLIWKSNWRRIPGNFALFPSLIFLLVLTAFVEWPGGWSYGTRYLFPAMGLVLYAYLPAIKYEGRKRLWIAIPIAIGLIHSFASKFTIQYSIPSESKFPFVQQLLPNLMAGNFNDTSLASILFNITSTSAALLFLGLFVIAMMTAVSLQDKSNDSNL